MKKPTTAKQAKKKAEKTEKTRKKRSKAKDTAKERYEGGFEAWRDKHGFTKEDEEAYFAMREAREFVESSENYLRSSCYWDAYQEDASGSILSGGSWYERWNLQEKMALMWYVKPSSEDFKSNIKSPMARGRINTFVNWMKRLNLEFGAVPNNKDDRNAAFIAERLVNYWFRNSNAKSALNDAWEDLAIHGNAYLKLSYVREGYDYKFPKIKDLTDEEREMVLSGELKVMYGDPEYKLIIDDMVLEHVPIREIYPEPQARNLHGDTYRAAAIARKRYVTLDYAKGLYANHPSAENVDKVKGSSAYRDTTEYFFEPPTDYDADDIVELIEIENQDLDYLTVIMNDIPIIWDEPLPQNHKELSYHKLDFIRVPGQFFSIGICDLLENIQASYEVTLNMLADYVYRTYNYRLLVESDNYGEITQALQRTGDMFIPIDASDGRPINSKVMPMQVSPIGFDIFSFLDLLEKNATLATNIDPAQMALLAGSKTATSDILNKELLMTMIGGVVENNTSGDLRQIGRQLWRLMQQHYTVPRVERIVEGDEEKTETTPRTVRFDGIELELGDDGNFEENEIEEYSFFEIKDEYLSTKDEVDVFIKPESKEVDSKALEEQKAAEEFAQLMPFAVDPNNPMQVMNHQMPMIDANKLFKEYFAKRKMPDDLLINKTKDDSYAVKQAEKHVMNILNDEHVQPIPGQPAAHLEYEYKVLDALIFKAEELQKEMDKDITKKSEAFIQMGAMVNPNDGNLINPQNGQPIPIEPSDKLMEQLESVEDKIEKLEAHIIVEAMPAAMRNTRIGMMNQQQPEPPMEGPEPPMPMGSNAPQVGMEDINQPMPGGEVPMVQGQVNPQMPPIM